MLIKIEKFPAGPWLRLGGPVARAWAHRVGDSGSNPGPDEHAQYIVYVTSSFQMRQ